MNAIRNEMLTARAFLTTGCIVDALLNKSWLVELSKIHVRAELRLAVVVGAPHCAWNVPGHFQMTDDDIDRHYLKDIPSSLRARLKKGIG